MSRYGKALAAAALAIITAVHTVLSDGHITQQEAVQIAIAAVTAFSVWLVPIIAYTWMKTAIAVVLAALNVLASVIIGGVNSGDWAEVLLAAVTVLVVASAPARSDPPASTPDPTRPAGAL